MRHIFAKKMFETNTDYGIKRYLSTKGFDTNREILYEDGPNKHLTCATQEPVEFRSGEHITFGKDPDERKKLIKKRAGVIKTRKKK